MIGPETLDIPKREDGSDEMINIGDLNDRARGAMTEHGLNKVLATCVNKVEQTESLTSKRTSKL